jgi:Fe-S cluster assembly ATP-binding protein
MNEDSYLLNVENLSLKRGSRDILSHLNLRLAAGEVHGLVGLNGSGKSSLAYALMRSAGYEPDATDALADPLYHEGLVQYDNAFMSLTEPIWERDFIGNETKEGGTLVIQEERLVGSKET